MAYKKTVQTEEEQKQRLEQIKRKTVSQTRNSFFIDNILSRISLFLFSETPIL